MIVNLTTINILLIYTVRNIKDSNIYIITVPTPINKFKKHDLSLINNAIKTVSKYLKKGGALVYATCSIEPEENLMVVDKFLNLNSNFVVDKIPNDVPIQWVKDNKALTVFPHEHGLDGIFAIRMKKIF